MTTTLPSSPIEFLEEHRLQQAKIDGFSFFIIRPDGDVPGFAYSIGMAQHDLPEILCYFNSEEMGIKSLGLMHNICTNLIEGSKRFARIPLLRSFCNRDLNAKDPEIVYKPKFLSGTSFTYALRNVITRAVRFRDQLGTPKAVSYTHLTLPTILLV